MPHAGRGVSRAWGADAWLMLVLLNHAILCEPPAGKQAANSRTMPSTDRSRDSRLRLQDGWEAGREGARRQGGWTEATPGMHWMQTAAACAGQGQQAAVPQMCKRFQRSQLLVLGKARTAIAQGNVHCTRSGPQAGTGWDDGRAAGR